MRIGKTGCGLVSGVAVAAASIGNITAYGGVTQDFENGVLGTSPSGWTVTSAGGSTPSPAAQVVSGTTPDGGKYLQLSDSNSGSTGALSYATYNTGLVDATGGVTLSFLLRRESGNANTDFVIFSRSGGNGGVMQAGISSGGFLYYSDTLTSTNIPRLPVTTSNVWYRFDITYTANVAAGTSTYSLAVTDTSSNTVLATLTGLSGKAFTAGDNNYANIGSVQLKTNNSGTGVVDIDGIAINAVPVPEAASVSLLLAGGCLLFRRRRA